MALRSVWLAACQAAIFLERGALVACLSRQRSSADVAREANPWEDKTASPDTRARLLLAKMLTDEKVQMLHGFKFSMPYVGMVKGNTRLGIPPLNMHDGPQGFRNEPGAKSTSTSWPDGMAMAATWDPGLMYQWGAAMGLEFKLKGANVMLGPGLNVARVPQNGRNFEYMAGEDPYLGYTLAGPVVKGIQDQHVIACAKHWVVNSQEDNRGTVSEDVDERTLHEVYYPPFVGAIEAGLGAVMCSYNRINGVYSCENPETLAGHLKTTLGFKGFVMSDWGATHSASFKQGLDMEMPVGVATNMLSMYVQKTKVDELDAPVLNTLRAMFAVGVMDEPFDTWNASKFFTNVSNPRFDKQARSFSAQGTVLLRNEGDILPLPKNRKILLLGYAADNAIVLSYGHGSGEVFPSHFVSPVDGIRAAAGADAEVIFNTGKGLKDAAAAARKADYAVVFCGASATEGADRQSLGDKRQDALITEVWKANPKTIVVLSVPGAFLMPWSGYVPAILTNFLPGQQGGHAIADILFGKVNPSAKLPITMPNVENADDLTRSQYPGVLGAHNFIHANYSEKGFVGYRHYDARRIQYTTGFPFGHGLSYTKFEYSNLHVVSNVVTLTVTNVGDVPGAEVAQLYLGFPMSAGEPLRQLKGFHKTAVLRPGQQESVMFTLRPRDLSIWDTAVHDWKELHGSFSVHVGASSRDLRLEGKLQNQVAGTQAAAKSHGKPRWGRWPYAR